MALQKTVTEKHGLIAANAYHRVEHICLENKTKLGFSVCSYASSTEEFPFLKVYLETEYNINGENPFKQAYEHLKTMSQYKDYTSV